MLDGIGGWVRIAKFLKCCFKANSLHDRGRNAHVQHVAYIKQGSTIELSTVQLRASSRMSLGVRHSIGALRWSSIIPT